MPCHILIFTTKYEVCHGEFVLSSGRTLKQYYLYEAAPVDVLSALGWERPQHQELSGLPPLTRTEQWHYMSQYRAGQHTGYSFLMKSSDAFQSVYLKSFCRKMFKGLGLDFEQNLTQRLMLKQTSFLKVPFVPKYCHNL